MKLLALTLTVMLISGCAPVFAQVTEAQAVKAILGESGGQSLYEKTAIACAIKNRDSLRGVYGYHSKTVYSLDIVQDAYHAWSNAKEGPDITHNATHWLSNWDLKHCKQSRIAWRLKMVKTLETDNFTFYRAKDNR